MLLIFFHYQPIWKLCCTATDCDSGHVLDLARIAAAMLEDETIRTPNCGAMPIIQLLEGIATVWGRALDVQGKTWGWSPDRIPHLYMLLYSKYPFTEVVADYLVPGAYNLLERIPGADDGAIDLDSSLSNPFPQRPTFPACTACRPGLPCIFWFSARPRS